MPTTRGTPSMSETQAAARVLFQHFCRERFESNGVDIDEQLLANDVENAFDGYSNALMASIGRDLRRIAEEVEKSCERETIRRRASEIEIFEMSYNHFKRLLSELFIDGISRERIVVLFFFCTDVALRAYNSYPFEYCIRLLHWSLNYILDTVCEWVQQHGGWSVVLGTYAYNIGYAVFMAVVGISCAIYIKKNLWPSGES